ncbi:MAG: hypothetical protein V4857_20885 [Pseudomonadota bacterium]
MNPNFSTPVKAVLLAALAAAFTPAQAAKSGKLIVEVKVHGQSVWTEGEDGATRTVSHVYRLATPSVSDGELDAVNNLDPRYLKKISALGASQPGALPAAPSAGQQAKLKQMSAVFEKRAQDCKGNQQCLYQMAMDASAQMKGVMPGAFGQPSVAAMQEFDADERYLNYVPQRGCKSEFTAVVNDKVEGRSGDVQGMVPYLITSSANMRATGQSAEMACMAGAVIVDVKTNMLFTHGLQWPGIKVSTVRKEGGKHVSTEEDAMLPTEVSEYIGAHFKHAPLKGTKRQVIKAKGKPGKPNETFSGAYTVDLTWRFETS